MPKQTTGKNTKGSKATAKKAPAKKTVANKKSTTKAASSKKTVNKKVAPKKVETVNKNEATKKIEAKKVEEKVMPKVKEEKKGNETIKANKDNIPFVVTLCIAIVLFICFMFSIFWKVVPKVKNGDEVLVALKGKNITAQKLYEDLRTEYGDEKLLDMIDSYIANKEVKVTADDEKYVKEVVDYYKQYAEYYGTDLSTFLANYVGLKGISNEKEFKKFVLADYKKTLAVQKFIGNQASEKDLKAYYKENFSDTITAKHILISVDSEAEDQEKAEKEALEKAKNIIKQLNKTDKDKLEAKFDSLAEENSDDTATYSKGGLIENFTKKDVEEPFYNAANDLKNGNYTIEPVKTVYGYHIILKVSSKPVEKYSKIKDKVKKEYAQKLMSEDATLSIKKWKELRKKYKMSIKDTEMKKAYNKNIKDQLENITSAGKENNNATNTQTSETAETTETTETTEKTEE